MRGDLFTWMADADGAGRHEHLRGAANAYANAMEAANVVDDFDLYGAVGALYGETCWALAHEPGEQPARVSKRALQGLASRAAPCRATIGPTAGSRSASWLLRC